jgi:hypothetical protein
VLIVSQDAWFENMSSAKDSSIKSSSTEPRVLREVNERADTPMKIANMLTRSSSKKKKETAVKFSPDKPKEVVSYAAVSIHTRSTSKKNGPTVKFSPVKPTVLHNEAKEVASKVAMSMRTQWTPAAQPEGTPIKVTIERYKDNPIKIYWASTEAKNLFRPKGNETVLGAMDAQIDLLVGALYGDNWKRIVDPEADLDKEFSDPGEVIRLKDKVMVLSVALDLAKSNMPIKTWAQCCDDAVKLTYALSPSDVKLPKAQKVMGWYREFRMNRFFPSNEKLKKEKRIAYNKKVAALLAQIEKGMSKVKIEM